MPSSILSILRNYPKYTWFIFGTFLMFISHGLGTIFMIDVVERLGGTTAQYGISQFVFAAAEVPAAMYFLKIKAKISVDKLMLCAAIFTTLIALGCALSPNVHVVILVQALEFFGLGMFYPGTVFMVVAYVDTKDVVTAMALINVASAGLGLAVGSIISGYLNQHYGIISVLGAGVVVGCISIITMIKMVSIKRELHAAL